MAEVEREDLTAAEFAMLAAVVEMNGSGRLGLLDALCRKTRLPEPIVKNAVRLQFWLAAPIVRLRLP